MAELLQQAMPKILIVDDSLSDILIMQKALAGLGEIYNAASGRQALDQLWLLKPEIVLLDIEMPDVNGLEICQSIRDEPTLADTRVIFVTAHEDDHTEYLSFKSGADDYLIKPYSINICRFRIQNQIRVWQLGHQAAQMLAVFDGLPQSIAVWDEHGQCLYVNQQFMQDFSLQSKTLAGVTMDKVFGQVLANELKQQLHSGLHQVDFTAKEAAISRLRGSIIAVNDRQLQTLLILSLDQVERHSTPH